VSQASRLADEAEDDRLESLSLEFIHFKFKGACTEFSPPERECRFLRLPIPDIKQREIFLSGTGFQPVILRPSGCYRREITGWKPVPDRLESLCHAAKTQPKSIS
jgi:hypothetical protein